MISNRIFRGKPAEVIFSYLQEILRNQGIRINRQERQSREYSFSGLIEGSKEERRELLVKIRITGEKEEWRHMGGGFMPTIHKAQLQLETCNVTEKGSEDTKESLKLLKNLSKKLNLYLWHTAG